MILFFGLIYFRLESFLSSSSCDIHGFGMQCGARLGIWLAIYYFLERGFWEAQARTVQRDTPNILDIIQQDDIHGSVEGARQPESIGR